MLDSFLSRFSVKIGLIHIEEKFSIHWSMGNESVYTICMISRKYITVNVNTEREGKKRKPLLNGENHPSLLRIILVKFFWAESKHFEFYNEQKSIIEDIKESVKIVIFSLHQMVKLEDEVRFDTKKCFVELLTCTIRLFNINSSTLCASL